MSVGASQKIEETLTKNDDGNVDGTQHAELVCLLEETILAL